MPPDDGGWEGPICFGSRHAKGGTGGVLFVLIVLVGMSRRDDINTPHNGPQPSPQYLASARR
jgi:hypothetical protein